MEELLKALPEKFDFYHLGEVRRDSSQEGVRQLLDDDSQAVAFALQGDVRGAMILVFDRGLDSSTYWELGNVIASRWATRLASEGKEVLVSPPRPATAEDVLRWVAASPELIAQVYIHNVHGRIIQVRACILPVSPEETSNDH